MCRAVRLPLVVEAGGHLALRDRMIPAVRHVLFARPDQLDRRAGHFLGDRDRLAHIVRPRPRRPKPPPRTDLVELAFADRQSGCFRHRRQRRLAVLRRRPHLAPVGGVERRGVHAAPWWRGSGTGSCRPPRPFGRAGERRLDVAALVADERLLGIEAGLEEFRDRGAGHLGVRARIPTRSGALPAPVLARHQVSAITATRGRRPAPPSSRPAWRRPWRRRSF